METFLAYYDSPLGALQITASDTFIASILFHELPKAEEKRSPLVEKCIEQLSQYFQGSLKQFDLPLRQMGTSFQQKVWNLLVQIPFGSTISYQQLTRQYGDINAIRAVASANGKNSLAVVVPCHRVIGSNQKLVGYAGGLWRKKWLLDHEAKFYHGVQELAFL